VSGALHALGRLCVRRRWIVLAVCLVFVIGVGLAGNAMGVRTSDNFSLPGTGSQEAQDILTEHFPALTNLSSPVVFKAHEGKVDEGASKKAVDDTVARLKTVGGVESVSDPFSAATVSKDRTIAYATVTMSVEPADFTHAQADDVVDATMADRDRVEIAVGGTIGQTAETSVEDSSEAVGLFIAIIVLLFTFGTVVAAGMPILTALIGLGAGLSLITVLGHVIAVPSVGPTLGTMIGLGVGIDYALFLITRHRQHLAAGMSVEESIPRTVATSGNAVVFAGITVVIALCSLALAGIPIVSALGYSAAIVVVIAVIASITLLPCLLAIAGTKINSLKLPGVHRRASRASAGAHGWRRWAEAMARRPWLALIAGVALLVVLTLPALHLTLGQADNGTAAPGTEQRVAFDLISEGFGPGANGPLLVAVPGKPNDTELDTIVKDLSATKGVASVSPAIPASDGEAAIITVTPTTSPADLKTETLVTDLRDAITKADVDAEVGGVTAGGVDLAAKITDRLPQVIATVIALSFLLLLLAFRSILLPIKAAVMNLFSIGAAYGVVTFVFQDGHLLSLIGLQEAVPIVSFVPLMMFAILFGLSMDYEVFLLSSCHERWQETGDPKRAVVDGIANTGRVITSAALIMVSVFAAFIGNDDATVKQFGLGMAVAVAVDATIVRCLLVPAVMVLMGKSAWWLPKWVDRWLPHVSVEGDAELKLPAAPPEKQPAPVG
jgi:putative drug exporter of the RND superfamily